MAFYWRVFVLLICGCYSNNGIVHNRTTNSMDYSSSWAIRIPLVHFSNLPDLHALADRIADEAGLVNRGQIGGLKGHYLYIHNNTFFNQSGIKEHVLGKMQNSITELLAKHPSIEWSRQEVVRMRYKRSLQFKDQYFPSQWHLDNLRFIGHDINVTGVWENNITGRGIVVSVIDDGVEWTNPDILDNYSSEGSWDINSNDDDPMPRADEAGLNHHGTRCAGEIAAVPNTYCAVGVAYGAKVSGVRILDGPMTDSLEAMAFNSKMHINDIYSCSWGPDDNGKTVDGPHQLAQAALAHGVLAGRKGYGSIFVVASGNGGHFKDNCNFDGYANSIYTVTIGAVDELGDMPYYAEHCAAMLAVTYSSGQGMQRNIVTTDWRLGTGTGCTDKHTGTSAAAPLAAGMIALMLQARPCLSWRDVQHIIAITAVKHDVDDSDYYTNGAKYHHSHKYGFGLLDSWRLVNTAKVWKAVPWMTSWSTPIIHVGKQIPTSTNQLIEKYYVSKDNVGEVVTLEHVTVTVNLKHRHRGNLMVSLVSAEGTTSKLATARQHDRSSDGFVDWTFSTVRCWGEKPQGTWQLIVIDNGFDHSRGFLKDWKLTFYGSSMTPEEIQKRQRLVEEASSGKYLHSNDTPPCPPRPPLYAPQDVVSERTLKVLLLLGGFCLLVSIYYTVDVVFDCEASDEGSADTASGEPQEETPLLSNKLAEEDQIRLSHILERGAKKGVTHDDRSKEMDHVAPSKHSTSPVDEKKRVEEFERRLRFAMEQSLYLQAQHLSAMDKFEKDLTKATEDSLLTHALHKSRLEETDANKKSKVPLKGILKKPRGRSSR